MRQTRQGLSIGELAKAAQVNLETIRYYQKRGLLPKPDKPIQGYTLYAPELVKRLAFIKSAQAMNFSLNEIKELFELSSADTANKAQIRQVAQARLQQVHEARQHLDLVESTLKTWLLCCEQSKATEPCPIILGLAHQTD